MRFSRKYLAIPLVLVMVLAAILVLKSNNSAQSAQLQVSSPHCRSGNPLEGVNNPGRLRLLSSCQNARGTVRAVGPGDQSGQRIDVRLDASYENLLGSGNWNYRNGSLVVERISGNQSSTSVPTAGQHISFTGPWVFDKDNGWNAIYPVWWIGVDK